MTRKDITLRSDKADQWQGAYEDVAAFLGYEPTDTEALMIVIATSRFGDGQPLFE